MKDFTKWVACWGTATSITERREAVYAKDITLRYPVHICFDGNALRLHFSNLTGTEDVVLEKVFAEKTPVTSGASSRITIPAGSEIVTDPVVLDCRAGQTINISFYLKDYTQLNAGTLVWGPLSTGTYAYGDFAQSDELPAAKSRSTQWYYFLNTVDIFTEEKNHAVCCFGDSITAQDWPDYLVLELHKRGITDTAVIRRAVCGTRILREYECITYRSYGLKGKTRFPIELNIAGADSVIIQHGINDIIHPVGTDVNIFRPMSDLPSLEDLKRGVEEYYISHCRSRNLRAFSGTLLPIYGWRTYAPFREELRTAFNEWLRSAPCFEGCIDFDLAVRDPLDPQKFAPGFDSGDHLHPSKEAYKAMALCAADFLERQKQ